MELTASFYKIKELKSYNPEGAEEIAYFHNNWGLHYNMGDGIVLVNQEKLKRLTDHAKDDENFNKDHSDGESVLTGVRKANQAIQQGYIVFYEGSY